MKKIIRIILFTLITGQAFSQQIFDEMQLVDISSEASIRSTVIRDPEQALLIIKTQISGLRVESNNIINKSEQVEPGTWHIRVAPGTHRLSFQADGFISVQERFYFNPKDVKGLNIRVIPAAEKREERNVGYIVIDSNPDSAQVYLNDQFYGTTPYMGKIVTGSYKLQLVKELYNIYEDTLVILSNKTLPVNIKLDPVLGSVAISSQPMGATVEINGRPVGKTPMTYQNLELGIHKISVKLDRYDLYNTEIVINKENLNQELDIKLTEKRSYLSVNGTPNGSQVRINGSKKGVLPIERITMPYGTHNITISRPGFYQYEKSIILSKPDLYTITVNLEPKNKTKSVVFSSVLPGSGQIYAGQTLRGVLLGIGALGGLGATLYLNQQYNQDKDQYNQDKEAYENNLDLENMDQLYRTMITSIEFPNYHINNSFAELWKSHPFSISI